MGDGACRLELRNLLRREKPAIRQDPDEYVRESDLEISICSVDKFDQHRLMIGCVGHPINLDVTYPGSHILRNKNEVTAIRSLRPLRMIVNAAGRLMPAAGIAEHPGIAIIQARPR